MLTHCLLTLFISAFLSLEYVHSMHEGEQHPFDLLIFTQSWPQTVCKEWKENNPSHTCTFPKVQDTWSIHGVWPTKLHTMGPAFCNRTWHFDPEAVRPIESKLQELWTNVEAGTSPYALWSHEWTKHGTCAAQLKPLNSEFNYFSTGLNWMQKFSMLNILNSHGIVPSNEKEYSIAAIHNAVTDSLHVNPAIECRKIDSKSWIVEIRICFDKSLHLTNCDGVLQRDHSIITNCGITENILYPKDIDFQAPPQTIYVELYKLLSWLQWFTL